MTTFAPAWANASAITRPRPLEPPVTRTTLFCQKSIASGQRSLPPPYTWESRIPGVVAGEEGGGLVVADDLLGLRVPLDHPAEPRGNRAEMAGVHRLHVAEHVGDGQPALADAAVEVLLVALERLALVEAHQVVRPELALVPVLLDRLAGDLAAVDEDAALGALEEDAVVAAAGRRSSRCRWRTCT